jgi:hypothetical protein
MLHVPDLIILIRDYYAILICGRCEKFQRRGHFLKCGSIKKTPDTAAFKMLHFSSYTLLAVFIQSLKTFLETTMNKLLQHNL